jgi:16S rRNA (cytosine967-C5)-methyltransferase
MKSVKPSLQTNGRAVCLAALMRVFKQGAYSNLSLNLELQQARLSSAEKRLATRIFYGTIQRRLFLEYQLQGLAKTKLQEAYLQPLLLMSLYQLCFLDRVPASAVLDQANQLAKAFGRHHSAGYRIVNGILRAFQRRGVKLPPAEPADQYWSIKESYPVWLVQYLRQHFGSQQSQQIMQTCNQPAKTSVCVSGLANFDQVAADLAAAGFQPQRSKLSTTNLLVKKSVLGTVWFKQGQLTLQDEAASLPVQAFDFNGSEQVLDACAAPGGKTVQLAERLPQGHVWALDLHQNKLQLIKDNAHRMQVANRISTRALDARKAASAFKPGQFQAILVDAPCSGLGLLRRKPEIRYTKSEQDLQQLSKIQLDLLLQVAPLLAPHGQLVYSTCTISTEEDEQVVQAFLQAMPQFALSPLPFGPQEPTWKILPSDCGSDGFFISKFILRG